MKTLFRWAVLLAVTTTLTARGAPPTTAPTSKPTNTRIANLPDKSFKKILFIGNSFTYENSLPNVLSEMLGGTKSDVIIDRVVGPGLKLKDHFEKGAAMEKIRAQKWDLVILQEQSQTPELNPAEFREFTTKFCEEITKTGAIPMIFMVWERHDEHATHVDKIARISNELGKELKVPVAPVGLAWEKISKENDPIALYAKDKYHPTQQGTYLAACVFCEVITGKSPVGLGIPKKLQGVTEAEATRLQRCAREIMEHSMAD